MATSIWPFMPGSIAALRVRILGLAALALAAPLAAVGCAHDPVAPAAAADWVTVRTPHFILHTDAGLGALDATAARFEQTYDALASAVFGQGLAAPVEALVFGDDGHYTALNGDTAGRFISGIGQTGSVLVARNSDDRTRLERVLAHELAHRFVRESYPRLPNWLSEGIAGFVETVEIRSPGRFDTEKTGLAVFGAAPREASHLVFSPGGVTFAELTSVPAERLYGGESRFYYSAAWALVHYLITGDDGRLRPRFGQLLDKVNAGGGRPGAVRAAFADVYPEKTDRDFDEGMKRNVRRLTQPLPDSVLRLPMRTQGNPPIAGQPLDPTYLSGLFSELRRRKRVVAEGPPLTRRPRFVRAEAGFSSLTRDYLGLAGGYVWRPTVAGEVHLGAGPLGLELALLGRYLRPLGEGGNFHLGVGVGPVVALKSLRLGNAPERERNVEIGDGDLFYFVGLQPDVAFEIHTPAGIVLRIGGGGYLRLAENQAALCQPRPGVPRTCEDTQPRTGPQVASARFSFHGRLAIGWTW